MECYVVNPIEYPFLDLSSQMTADKLKEDEVLFLHNLSSRMSKKIVLSLNEFSSLKYRRDVRKNAFNVLTHLRAGTLTEVRRRDVIDANQAVIERLGLTFVLRDTLSHQPASESAAGRSGPSVQHFDESNQEAPVTDNGAQLPPADQNVQEDHIMNDLGGVVETPQADEQEQQLASTGDDSNPDEGLGNHQHPAVAPLSDHPMSAAEMTFLDIDLSEFNCLPQRASTPVPRNADFLNGYQNIESIPPPLEERVQKALRFYITATNTPLLNGDLLLKVLKEAGLDYLPGTSRKLLDHEDINQLKAEIKTRAIFRSKIKKLKKAADVVIGTERKQIGEFCYFGLKKSILNRSPGEHNSA